MNKVPTIYNDRNTFLHRRDPRIKVFCFLILVVLLYIAPTWQWMLGLTGLGIGLCFLARVPLHWMGILWLLQLPNVIGLIIIPSFEQLTSGNFAIEGSLAFSLKLALAWSAALFVSISLFSTMRVNELVDGMRGIGFPEIICFATEYTFMLMYLSLNDIFRIADAMKIKGLNLETRNPVKLMINLPYMTVPIIFTIVRRATTMMSVLQMRGYSFFERNEDRNNYELDLADSFVLGIACLIFIFALDAKFRLGISTKMSQLIPLIKFGILHLS